MNKHNSSLFQCTCDIPKNHKLIFDGGSSGIYELELCNICYQKEDKQFVISEEIIP